MSDELQDTTNDKIHAFIAETGKRFPGEYVVINLDSLSVFGHTKQAKEAYAAASGMMPRTRGAAIPHVSIILFDQDGNQSKG